MYSTSEPLLARIACKARAIVAKGPFDPLAVAESPDQPSFPDGET